MMSNNSDSDEQQQQQQQQVNKTIQKTCAWCKGYKLLVPSKKYCSDCCGQMYRECSRCRLPYPTAESFTLSDLRCNSCQKKYVKEKQKREQKQQQQQQQQCTNTTAATAAGVSTGGNKRKANVEPSSSFEQPIIFSVDDDENDEGNDDGDSDMRLAVRILRRWKGNKRFRKDAILLF